MADSPERSTLLQQACILRQDVLPEELQVITLSQEVSTCTRLHKLSIEVNRVLDRLVLDWENFDALDDLVEEELAEDVLWVIALALLSREAEVDAVFHHKKALLAL